MLKRLLTAVMAALILCGCSGQEAPTPSTQGEPSTTLSNHQPEVPAPPSPPPDPITQRINEMSTEALVGQLFLAHFPGRETAGSDAANYHLGGFLFFKDDFEFENSLSLSTYFQGLQATVPIPLLLAVDEEGGTVTRVSCHEQFRETRFHSPRWLYKTGGLDPVLQTEQEKCQLLKSLGLNINLAPVCDVTTDPKAFMYNRSLGLDPQATADVISAMVKAISSENMGNVLKHFPGYGNNTDTHTAAAIDTRSLAELEANDLLPFRAGIESGCDAILVSHTVVACLDDSAPASLSPTVVGYLRNTMGFDGVIITDDLAMDAIEDKYGAGEAAVLALLAGNDLLCTSEYALQYAAVLDAVSTGRIAISQIRDSVGRILRWKDRIEA